MYERNGVIYRSNYDGANERRITPGSNAFEPAWSPDGTKIAFRGPGAALSDIHVINVDGSNEQVLPLRRLSGETRLVA